MSHPEANGFHSVGCSPPERFRMFDFRKPLDDVSRRSFLEYTAASMLGVTVLPVQAQDDAHAPAA